MLMPIAITKGAIWADANASTEKTSLWVRPFSEARPSKVFLAAELALLVAAMLEAVWNSATFGIPILIGCCAAPSPAEGDGQVDRSFQSKRDSGAISAELSVGDPPWGC